MNDLYYNKYIHNKNKYLSLKYNNNQKGGVKEDKKQKYYILHSTDLKNIISIIKTGSLLANKYLDQKQWRFSGLRTSEYIFTNLVINGQKFSEFGFGLILDEKLLDDKVGYFNIGWLATPQKNSIILKPNDTKKERDKKMKKIKKVLLNSRPVLDHELLFKKEINLKDYLIGILIPKKQKKNTKKIKKLLKSSKLDKVKLYITDNIPVIN